MCRQHKGILTELLDKRLSPGRGQVDSCVRKNVLTFFLSEVFSQAWPEPIITQVKGSLVLFVASFIPERILFAASSKAILVHIDILIYYCLKKIHQSKGIFFFFCKCILIFNYCIRGDFPGSPVVTTPHFHCREHKFSPWLGNQDPAYCCC